jgi:hypothetical protein
MKTKTVELLTSISLKNNKDGSSPIWSETQWSGTAVHIFCWAKRNQVPTEPLREPKAEKEDKKPKAISGELFKGRSKLELDLL